MPRLQKLDMDKLHDWVELLALNADHHGQRVRNSALAMVGFVMAYADPASLKTSDGERHRNLLVAEFQGYRVVFSYNHRNKKIDARERTWRGTVIRDFDDKTGLVEMGRFFRSLLKNKAAAASGE